MAIKGIKIGSTTNKIDISSLESEGNAGKFIKAGSSGPVWDSPVTGTNDGTNWTSLSIQTASGLQEYAIPSEGGGGTTLNQYTYTSSNSNVARAKIYRICKNSKGNVSIQCNSLPAYYSFTNYGITIHSTTHSSVNNIYFDNIYFASGGGSFSSDRMTLETDGTTLSLTNSTPTSANYIFIATYYNDTEIT